MVNKSVKRMKRCFFEVSSVDKNDLGIRPFSVEEKLPGLGIPYLLRDLNTPAYILNRAFIYVILKEVFSVASFKLNLFYDPGSVILASTL